MTRKNAGLALTAMANHELNKSGVRGAEKREGEEDLPEERFYKEPTFCWFQMKPPLKRTHLSPFKSYSFTTSSRILLHGGVCERCHRAGMSLSCHVHFQHWQRGYMFNVSLYSAILQCLVKKRHPILERSAQWSLNAINNISL